MRVLVACEMSGRVREAFRRKGHDAYSCDLLPALDNSPYHYQDDVLKVIDDSPGYWDLMIAHPPCTALTVAGNGTYASQPDKIAEAVVFVLKLAFSEIPKIVIENPVGRLSTFWRKPDQYIQPYWFGEDASKKTGLWLKNLPLLAATEYVDPRIVNGRPRWANQTDSGQNKLTPSADRSMIRSLTYQGIANAFAEQWG